MLGLFVIAFLIYYFLYKLISVIGCKYFKKYSDLWDGPIPTKAEQDDNLQWITTYLQDYPESDLAKEYPQCATNAHLYRAYVQLNNDLEAGAIDEIEYEARLSKILPLIDLKELSL